MIKDKDYLQKFLTKIKKNKINRSLEQKKYYNKLLKKIKNKYKNSRISQLLKRFLLIINFCVIK